MTHNLVGRVVSEREISFHTIKSNVMRLLQPVKKCEILPISSNRFMIKFHHPLDCKHAMEGCPWVLDRNALLFHKLLEGESPEGVEIKMMNIVVRAHNVPISYRTMEVATRIGNRLGSFTQFLNSHQADVASFLRIKVAVDVTKCLQRGFFIHKADDAKTWLDFTYEKLPTFCFLCGIVGHTEPKCPLRYDDQFADPGDDFPYGVWMKASFDRDLTTSRIPLSDISLATSSTKSQSPPITKRGSDKFEFFSRPGGENTACNECVGKENNAMLIVGESVLITNPIHIDPDCQTLV
ncbi:PREDICTED: uncharacterized protein LOC105972485 [Erythranthe guttata]|uniref:uncharacterized protein LOC105972485 n=1 Tax=Erythranthe guttata TaxID=4155 RepID=UPI00064DE122|nr:PREDICTED: uncharacterized protein LOC105972485 [Erythranthe guttata]|eukprot:XP_012852901.1 PREDICTED: uncharacterized protein LOC105972485 [Erythranthe guttata]